jgi:hypothetical protein
VSGRDTAMTQTHLGLGSGSPRLDDVEPHVDRETPAPTVALPYAALIKAQLAAGDVRAARTLLDAALREPVVSDELRRLKKVLAPPRVAVSDTVDGERSAEYAWLARHARDYGGQWVALDGERLLARGHRLKEVLDALKTMGLLRTPLVHRVE